MKKETLFTAFDNRGYGGKRAGAGRKPTGRKRLTLWVTPQEESYLRLMLETLRAEQGED